MRLDFQPGQRFQFKSFLAKQMPPLFFEIPARTHAFYFFNQSFELQFAIYHRAKSCICCISFILPGKLWRLKRARIFAMNRSFLRGNFS